MMTSLKNDIVDTSMDIHQEKREPHSIEAYSASAVRIKQQSYTENLIVSAEHLLPSWAVNKQAKLTETDLAPLLALEPEIVLVGSETLISIDFSLQSELTKKRIGLECMSLGAASRTFNILLNESRRVVLGLIF